MDLRDIGCECVAWNQLVQDSIMQTWDGIFGFHKRQALQLSRPISVELR
jgi:hypothetical protein